MKLEFGVSTVQGERPYMEDRYALEQGPTPMAGVYDGHGGEHAAEYCQVYLINHILQQADLHDEPEKTLIESFIEIDEKMRDYFKIKGLGDDGSTALVFALLDEQIVIANAGDSRALMIQNGKVTQITTDHKPTLVDESKRIIDNGGYVQSERLCGVLAVSRSLGDFSFKPKDLPPANQWMSAIPEVQLLPIEDNMQWFLLATDGIFDVLSNQEVANELLKQSDPNIAAHHIVQLAEQHESFDNLTVVAIKVLIES